MKAYMGYAIDPAEGAALIFANTAREAKRAFWRSCAGSVAGEEFTEVRIQLLRGKPWLFEEMPQESRVGNLPCVLDSPRSCSCCGTWGHEPIGPDGKCGTCGGPACGDIIHHL